MPNGINMNTLLGALQLFRDYLSGKRYLEREKDWALPSPVDLASMSQVDRDIIIMQGIQALGIRATEDRALADAADTIKQFMGLFGGMFSGMAAAGVEPAQGQLASSGGSTYSEGGKRYFVGLPPAGSVRGYSWNGKEYVGPAPTAETAPNLYGQGALQGYQFNWQRNAWETVG